MTLRLQSLVAQAASLPEDVKERLADSFERQLRAEGVVRIFSPEEVEALEQVIGQVESEPDEPELSDEEWLAEARRVNEEEAEHDFTPEELAELERMAAGPFVEATPEQMARIAAWRG